MRNRVASALAALGLVATSVLSTAGVAAAADGSTTTQSQWKRYHQEDFTVPAGHACSFEVKAHVLFDREFYRTISRFANGNPRAQLFRGPLIIRFTNTASGQNTVRNLSGIAIERFNSDGSFHAIQILSGQFSASLPPGSTPDQGIYVVHGSGARLVVNQDGTESLKLGPHGRAENLCTVLGDADSM